MHAVRAGSTYDYHTMSAAARYSVESEFLERGQFPGDSFDKVGESRSLVVVIGDGEDVDLDGHGGCGRQLVLAEGTEDGLRADDDYLLPFDDLACSADRVLKLVASH
jgi:hypothetical protein